MRVIPSHCGLTLPAMPQVNNAAQTLTRESGWYARMETLEQNAYQSLEPEARSLLATSDALLGLTGPGLDPSPGPGPGSIGMNSMNGQGAVFHTPSLEAGALVSESKPEPQERPEPAVQEGTLEDRLGEADAAPGSELPSPELPRPELSSTELATREQKSSSTVSRTEGLGVSAGPSMPYSPAVVAAATGVPLLQVLKDEDLAAFPEGRLDESLQPLDLSLTNSW